MYIDLDTPLLKMLLFCFTFTYNAERRREKNTIK